MDFTDKAFVLSIIEERYGSVPVETDLLLDLTTCVDALGTVTYRPYAVLSSLIETNYERYKRVKSASGSEVEYQSLGDAVSALNGLQSVLDKRLGLVCGDDTDTLATSNTFQVYL